MPASPLSVNVSVAVSAIASGYTNGKLIGDQLAPVCPHTNKEGTYFSTTRADSAADFEDALESNSKPSESDYEQGATEFITKGRGGMTWVPYDVINAAADPLKPLQQSTELLMWRIMLKQERRVAELLLTSGNYASGCTGTATALWSNTATSKPILDFHTGVLAMAPDSGIDTKIVAGMSIDGWLALVRHPDILGKLGPADARHPQEEDVKKAVAPILGVDEIYVSDAEYRTSAKGASFASSRVWDRTKVVILRVPSEPLTVDSALMPLRSFALQFRWLRDGGFPMHAVEWDDKSRGGGDGSKGIKVSHNTVEKVIQSDQGYLLTSVLS